MAPIRLILDWDGTLTKKDTLHLIGTIGTNALRSRGIDITRFHPQQDPDEPPWNTFGRLYMSDYAALQSQYKPTPEERRSVADEAAWLAALEPVELASMRRVEESGFLKGVMAEDVRREARRAVENGEVQLRREWERVFLEADLRTSVLSVNWSAMMIRECLLRASDSTELGKGEKGILAKAIQDCRIDANEIEGLDDPQGASGKLSKSGALGIRTSRDKLRLLRCEQGVKNNLRRETNLVVYVGDSATDLECLLAADYGICMHDEPMGSGQGDLDETLRRVGVRVDSADVFESGVSSTTKETGRELGKVWWTEDFIGVMKFLNKLQNAGNEV